MDKREGCLLFTGSVLVMSVILQLGAFRNVSNRNYATQVMSIPLAERIPNQLRGLIGHDEPLGSTEVARTAVERTLNYNDYVSRVFTRGEWQLGIYVAFWSPGQMPAQKIASHTPDRCWTENGWRCEDMRFAEPVTLGQTSLLPAQWRRFVPPGDGARQQYVLYWHLVGDHLYDYGTRFNTKPDFVRWWRDALNFALSGNEAQYFIRITSNRPFEELKGDPGWEELLRSLAELGLDSKAQEEKR